MDEFLKEGCKSRVACETMIMPDKVLIMGEVSTQAKINVERIVRKVLNDVGYSKDYYGISPTNDTNMRLVTLGERILKLHGNVRSR